MIKCSGAYLQVQVECRVAVRWPAGIGHAAEAAGWKQRHCHAAHTQAFCDPTFAPACPRRPDPAHPNPPVGQLCCLLLAVHARDAAVGESAARRLGARQQVALPLHLPLHRIDVHPRQRHQHRLAVGAVLSLGRRGQGGVVQGGGGAGAWFDDQLGIARSLPRPVLQTVEEGVPVMPPHRRPAQPALPRPPARPPARGGRWQCAPGLHRHRQ